MAKLGELFRTKELLEKVQGRLALQARFDRFFTNDNVETRTALRTQLAFPMLLDPGIPNVSNIGLSATLVMPQYRHTCAFKQGLHLSARMPYPSSSRHLLEVYGL